MRIDILNHAAALVEHDGVRLLSDPWFGGTAFSGGWGLRYANPRALDLAATATHLWISHWHSDHLHPQTLKELAARAPGITVLANHSANFSMVEPLTRMGFRHVVPLGEREPLTIAPGVRVIRYPTASIDNMLVVESGGLRWLNYNDCNLPIGAVRRLRARFGAIDVLLCNYNHAGKLFAYPGHDAVKDAWWAGVMRTVDALAPRRVVPFASSHVYRAPATLDQNGSLIDFDELATRAAGDPRFVIARIGERIELDDATLAARVERVAAATRNPIEPHDYGPSVPWAELESTARTYLGALAASWAMLARVVAPEPVIVWVEDHRRAITLDARRGPQSAAPDADEPRWHMAMHSRALADWMGRRFGEDTLLAGAHFRIGPQPAAAQRLLLACALTGNDMGPKHLLGWARSRAGRRLLWNRREEVVATLLGRRLRAGAPRL